jgi:hypothetical protein
MLVKAGLLAVVFFAFRIQDTLSAPAVSVLDESRSE